MAAIVGHAWARVSHRVRGVGRQNIARAWSSNLVSGAPDRRTRSLPPSVTKGLAARSTAQGPTQTTSIRQRRRRLRGLEP